MTTHPLQQFLTESGISVEAIAADAGLHKSTVYRIMHGETVPTLATMDRLVAAVKARKGRGVTVRSIMEYHRWAPNTAASPESN